MEAIATDKAPAAIGPYSQAIKHCQLVFTAGQIALRADGTLVEGGIAEQTGQVIKNLSAVLEKSGSSLDKVVKTTVFLADMQDFAAMNEVYARHFTAKPARSTVAVMPPQAAM